MNYKNKRIIEDLSNDELEKKLCESNYCNKDLFDEYDKRVKDGRIKFAPIPMNDLEGYIRRKYEARLRKKAS